MQVMVEEIPDIGWLCETCQIEVQKEKKNTKLENFQLKIGASNGESIDVKANKPANDANAQSSSKDEGDAKYFGSVELKRLNSPEPSGLSIEADSTKRVLLSRECSFKFGTEKGTHTTSQALTSSASNALENKARPLHGKLVANIHANRASLHTSRMFTFCYHCNKLLCKPTIEEITI